MAKARLLIASTALLIAAACSGSSVHTATYATVDEARASGAIDNGEIPAFIPKQAYELRAAYAVGGDKRWGLFNFRPEHADALRAVLQPEEVSLAGTAMEIPPRIEWWPVILRGTVDAERATATGLRAYRSTADAFVVAVNWSQGRAYYWKQ